MDDDDDDDRSGLACGLPCQKKKINDTVIWQRTFLEINRKNYRL